MASYVLKEKPNYQSDFMVLNEGTARGLCYLVTTEKYGFETTQNLQSAHTD